MFDKQQNSEREARFTSGYVKVAREQTAMSDVRQSCENRVHEAEKVVSVLKTKRRNAFHYRHSRFMCMSVSFVNTESLYKNEIFKAFANYTSIRLVHLLDVKSCHAS